MIHHHVVRSVLQNKRDRYSVKTKKYSDGKKEVENIEDLFFEYIRIANDIQPKVIIIENVARLTKQLKNTMRL